jgi:osmotically-inducible protein OsmY
MKRSGLFSVWVPLVLAVCLFSSCSQQRQDRNIKADIATKAKTDLNFAGVRFTVSDGIVSLTGRCPTQKAKEAVEKTVRDISIVKDIVGNSITNSLSNNLRSVLLLTVSFAGQYL